jgi:hypothetical protein
MSAAAGLTVATSDPANPRIDKVCAWVQDNGDATSDAYVQVFTGTPTSGATLSNHNGAPANPANAILLAYVLVPANATSIVSGDIGDARGYTVSQGGILPVAAASAGTGYTGKYIHDLTSGSLRQNAGSGTQQMKVLPFAPVRSFVSPPAAYHGGTLTLTQVTFTADGSTDIEIYCAITSANANGGTGDYLDLAVNLDASRLWTAAVSADGLGSGHGGATSFTYRTSTATGDRPSAGTHTVYALYSDNVGTSGSPSQVGAVDLHVRAVSL